MSFQTTEGKDESNIVSMR